MARKHAPVVLAALSLAVAGAGGAQDATKSTPDKPAPLNGVWELFEVRVAGGKLAERSKLVMFNRGPDSHWAWRVGHGQILKPQRLTVGEKGAVEFVNQNDNLTIRGLYEFSDKDLLKMCWRDDNKTLFRPERMSPLPEKCAYHLFRRMAFETDAKTECDKELAGLWSTVSIAIDGKRIEKKDFDYTFEQHEIALYVEGDHFLIMQEGKRSDLEVLDARFRLKPKTTERAANVKFPDDSLAQAIYAVKGDQLTICWTKNGERPDSFKTEAGDGRSVYQLKRVMKLR